jgi:hypothetical protein
LSSLIPSSPHSSHPITPTLQPGQQQYTHIATLLLPFYFDVSLSIGKKKKKRQTIHFVFATDACSLSTYTPTHHADNGKEEQPPSGKKDKDGNHSSQQHQMSSNFKTNPLFFGRLFCLLLFLVNRAYLSRSVACLLTRQSPSPFLSPSPQQQKLKPPLVHLFFCFCHDSAWQPEENNNKNWTNNSTV